MPLILSGNVASAVAGAYEVANSCRFNDGDSPHMTITPGGAGSTKIFTASFWVKRGVLGTDQEVITTYSSGNDNTTIRFLDTDALDFVDYQSSAVVLKKVTNRLFRDPSAWYHIVCNIDTNQAVAANRAKIYVNGVQETSFSTNTIYDEDATIAWNKTYAHYIGQSGSGARYLDGYLAEVCVIDGSALAPASFGEFDEDSPTIWKPIDVSGLTFGTNGFYLDFEASDNLGNDANGGTDLGETNLAATDQTTDSPTNSFCTFMSNHPSATNFTLSEGGTRVVKDGSGIVGLYGGSIMPTAGKWYFEVLINEAGNGDRTRVGIVNYESVTGTSTLQDSYSGVEVSCKSAKLFEVVSASTTEYTSSGVYADDDIVNIAIDLDNKAIYVGRNGTWLTQSATSGGDPTSGASKTGAISTNTTIMNGTPMSVYLGHSAGASDKSDVSFNFGNPAYANSSSAADANGYGAFEYAPPSGYLSLCTKNLGSDGG